MSSILTTGYRDCQGSFPLGIRGAGRQSTGERRPPVVGGFLLFAASSAPQGASEDVLLPHDPPFRGRFALLLVRRGFGCGALAGFRTRRLRGALGRDGLQWGLAGCGDLGIYLASQVVSSALRWLLIVDVQRFRAAAANAR